MQERSTTKGVSIKTLSMVVVVTMVYARNVRSRYIIIVEHGLVDEKN